MLIITLLPRQRYPPPRLAAALFTAALLLFVHSKQPSLLPRTAAAPPASGACVAWRATQCGTQLAGRLPVDDLPCEATIRPAAKRLSGFCECAHQTLTRTELAVGCGRSAGSDLRRWLLPARPFTCEEACARKIRIKTGRAAGGDSGRGAGALAGVSDEAAVPRPSGGTAAADRPDCPAESHPSLAAPPPPPPPAAEEAEEAASRSVREQLWADLDRAFIAAGGLNVQPAPGLPKCPNLSGPSPLQSVRLRTLADCVAVAGARGFGGGPSADFVADGLRMAPASIAAAAAQLRSFLAAVPTAPPKGAWPSLDLRSDLVVVRRASESCR